MPVHKDNIFSSVSSNLDELHLVICVFDMAGIFSVALFGEIIADNLAIIHDIVTNEVIANWTGFRGVNLCGYT